MALIKEKIKQQNKEEYAYKKMLSYGWTPDQAAGIVGNLKHESGLNTGAGGDIGYSGGSSFGLAQWRQGRLDTLKKKYGSAWKDLDSQLDFVNWELNNTHKKVGDRLRNTQGIYNTGALVSDKYEIPAKKFHQNKGRQKDVFSIYEKYSGVPLTELEQQQFLKGAAQRAIDSYAPPTNEVPITYTPEVSSFVEPINIPTLAPENETEAVQKAKEELNSKQQQQINQQRFIQDLLVASQVQYVDPNQVQQEDIYNQEQYFQRGGIYDLPMNNANPITPKQFTLEYLNSPKYRERLKNSGYEDVDGEIKRRLAGTNPEVFPYKAPPAPNVIQSLLGKKQEEGERGSYYSPFTKKIQLDSKYNIDTHRDVYPNATQPTSEEIETHERSHATTSLFPEDRFNKTDIRRLTNYHKKDKNIPEHDLIPGENKADLDAFRYLLKREGVYDAGKQDFTPEMFKRTKKSATKDRLQSVYSDEAIIYLMNNVAQNEDNNLIYGQNGGALSSVFGQTGLVNIIPKVLIEDNNDKRKLSDVIKINSSLNEGETNYVRTVKPTDKPLKRDKLVEQQASQDFINWYSDPATKEKFSKNTGLDANRLQDFIGKGLRTPVREAETNEDIGYLSKIGADALYTSPYFQQTSNRGTNEKTGEILYQRQRESTPYSKAPNMRSVLGHELSHASNIDAVVAPALQRVLGDVNNQQKGTFKRDREYLSHPEETYGNFHMFRQNLGLKPGQKVDIKQLQQMVKEKGLDEEIFYKAYDDDKIVKAINTIAQNNPETSAVYAQNGGNIPISSNGVYDYPQQEVIVPTDSGLITMKNVNYPILGVDEYGNRQMMYPNQEYQFKGKVIHEIPQLKRTKNKRFS